MKLSRLFGRAILLTLLGLSSTALRAQSPIESSPRAIVHLLDYLAADYGGAVRDGKVIEQFEYNEQIEFADLVLKIAGGLDSTDYHPVVERAKNLQRLIHSKADAEKVSEMALSIKSDVLKISKLNMSPESWPNFENAKSIFQAQCISCHGSEGRGDGPAAKGLEPAPRNFHDGEYMQALNAFHNFNVIRLGIPGTGMAAYPHLKDRDIWDLSFYILSLRYADRAKSIDPEKIAAFQISLDDAAQKTDEELKTEWQLSDKDSEDQLAILRTKSAGSDDDSGAFLASLDTADRHLTDALEFYRAGNTKEAMSKAAMAYLDGVEPLEPTLLSMDSKFVMKLETSMARVRSVIGKKRGVEELEPAIQEAQSYLNQAKTLLQQAKDSSSPWITFSLAFGIVLREGFEAVLILLAILGVIRATKARRAKPFVHAGWVVAVLLGLIAWVFSGWVMKVSGAQRELTEGFAALLAVVVLLYMGFWLHSKSEIKRWTSFIDGRVRTALEGSGRWGLFGLAFIAVFREALETVLFMRALVLQGGSGSQSFVFSGVVLAFVAVFGIAWALLKWSVRIPVRQMFAISSWVMAILSIILVGKGFHAFQEVGWLPITTADWTPHFPIFGIYPSLETTVAQITIIGVCIVLWLISSVSGKPTEN